MLGTIMKCRKIYERLFSSATPGARHDIWELHEIINRFREIQQNSWLYIEKIHKKLKIMTELCVKQGEMCFLLREYLNFIADGVKSNMCYMRLSATIAEN